MVLLGKEPSAFAMAFRRATAIVSKHAHHRPSEATGGFVSERRRVTHNLRTMTPPVRARQRIGRLANPAGRRRASAGSRARIPPKRGASEDTRPPSIIAQPAGTTCADRRLVKLYLVEAALRLATFVMRHRAVLHATNVRNEYNAANAKLSFDYRWPLLSYDTSNHSESSLHIWLVGNAQAFNQAAFKCVREFIVRSQRGELPSVRALEPHLVIASPDDGSASSFFPRRSLATKCRINVRFGPDPRCRRRSSGL